MAEPQRQAAFGFGVANYRSFDDTGFVVDEIGKINVFIGKNNSGKSNVLRAIRMLRRIKSPKMPQGNKAGYEAGLGLSPEIDSHKRTGTPPTAAILFPPGQLAQTDEMLGRRLSGLRRLWEVRWNTATGECDVAPLFQDLDDKDLLKLHRVLATQTYRGIPRRQQILSDLLAPLLTRAIQALRAFDPLICVEGFREIRKAESSVSEEGSFNGHNVIERLRVMQHPKIGNEKERVTFDRIQEFVRGLLGEPELRLEVPTEEEAIYVSMHQKRLPLASCGTGVHQLVILCAALSMHEEHVVCIEEPEIHLHPELQRKFIQFIAEQTNNRYFITTHSNVFLDLRPDVLVYHVSHDGTRSTVTRVEATSCARDVLADLGYKASDLLQSNCVVWVEGPSDRIYLKAWLSLIAPDLVEGIHYGITFYGGRSLSHFTGADESTDDLVEVLRINQHAIFVMDRDHVKANGMLNRTKERIQAEMVRNNDGLCWVTKGREIENYLRPGLVSGYLSERFAKDVNVKFATDDRLAETITIATTGLEGSRVDYAREKVAYARAFSARLQSADLDVLDLHDRLMEMVARIRKWNQS